MKHIGDTLAPLAESQESRRRERAEQRADLIRQGHDKWNWPLDACGFDLLLGGTEGGKK